MKATLIIVVLAMLAMANAAPVQEDQKNLQGLLDALADQKTNMESVVQAANLVKQQQDDGGSQEAEAQLLGKLIRCFWANKQQNEAQAQLLGSLAQHALKSIRANKQQDDNGNEAEAEFIGRLLKNVANVQQSPDYNTADAQFWGKLIRFAAPRVFKYFKKKYD